MYLFIDILQILIDVARWVILIQFILSILVAFNVISLYNDTVRTIVQGINAVTEPIYRPVRKLLPNTGAIDFAPMVVLIILMIVDYAVIPAIIRTMNGGAL